MDLSVVKWIRVYADALVGYDRHSSAWGNQHIVLFHGLHRNGINEDIRQTDYPFGSSYKELVGASSSGDSTQLSNIQDFNYIQTIPIILA